MKNQNNLEIEKDDFELFEDVRLEGVVNMSVIENVACMSGLSKEKVSKITNNYEYYKNKFQGKNK